MSICVLADMMGVDGSRLPVPKAVRREKPGPALSNINGLFSALGGVLTQMSEALRLLGRCRAIR